MSKILLVEDDNNLREIYEARLQAEGYTTISARDGEEALVFAKNEKPDLVISDVMMPKISGFEMLDILRNTEGLKQVKVIMLTALGQSDDQQRASRLGADHYLVKSQVTLEDIVKVAHELLQDEPAPAPAPQAPTPVAAPVPTQPPVAAPVVAAPAPVVPVPQVTPQPQVNPAPPEQPVAPQPSPTISVSSPVTAPPVTVPSTPAPQPAPAPAPQAPTPVAAPVPTQPPVAAPVVAAPAPVVPVPQVTPQPQVNPAPPEQPVAPQPSPTISVSSPVTAPPVTVPSTPAPQPAPAPAPQAPTPVAAPVPTQPPVAAPVVASVNLPEAEPENESNPSISVASFFANATDMNANNKPAVEDTPTPTNSDTEYIESEAKATEESVAQSTAEEEASVEAKIEDFVTGASSNPDKPVVESPNKPSDSESNDTQNLPNPNNEENAKSDDNLMQNAVNTLITESEPKLPSSPITITPSTSSTLETGPPQENTSTSLDTVPEPTTNGKNENVTIAHKKIISPMDAEPKQDLNTLLAIESAKEGDSTQSNPAIISQADQTRAETNPQSGSVIAPPPSVPPPLGSPVSPPASPEVNDKDGHVDPNSIAL